MTSQELFYEALKAKRRAMGAANRKKSKKGGVKPADQWIYPAHVENKYFKYISALQKKIIAPTTLMVKNNLDKWQAEYKADGVIKDNIVPISVVDQDEQNIIDHKQALDEIENPKKKKKKKKSLFSLFKKKIKKDAFSNEIAEEMARLQGIVNELYGENAPTIKAFITSIGQDVSDFNMKQYQKYMKGILGVEFIATEAWEAETIAAWTETNFSLIQKLSNEYIVSINTIVSEGVQFGTTTDEIMRQIRATNKNISDARSRLIARDQVGKLNGLLTERRMTDAGIDMYTWLTAGDERVRSKHKTMNNRLCRWDDNSVYSVDGGETWIPRTSDMTHSIPGQDIQCRCTAIPYFEHMIGQIDDEILVEEVVAKPPETIVPGRFKSNAATKAIASHYGVTEQTVLNIANTYSKEHPQRKVNIGTIENLLKEAM